MHREVGKRRKKGGCHVAGAWNGDREGGVGGGLEDNHQGRRWAICFYFFVSAAWSRRAETTNTRHASHLVKRIDVQ